MRKWIWSVITCFAHVSISGVCMPANATTTLPIHIYNNDPLVIVKINGVDVSLGLDTGDSTALVLLPSVLARVGAVLVGGGSRTLDVKGNVISSKNFELAVVEIGGERFTNVRGHEDLHDPTYPAAQVQDKQGHLGTLLLRSLRVVLDFPHQKITLISNSASRAEDRKCRGVSVGFLPQWSDALASNVEIDHETLTAVWDTGAPVSILRRAGAQDIGAEVLTQTASTVHFKLGGVEFGPAKLLVADFKEPQGADMFIGYPFFARHVVCMDFPGHRFLVQR